MKSTDTAKLLSGAHRAAAASAGKVVAYWRFGRVIAWDPFFGTNQIDVGGTVMENLPSLAGTGALFLNPGDTVIVAVAGTSFMVLGAVRSGENFQFPVIGVPLALGYGIISQWPTFTSSSYTQICYAGVVQPMSPGFSVWVQTSVPAGATAQFRTLVNGVQVDESTVFVAGDGQYAQSIGWPPDTTPADQLPDVSIEGKRISGSSPVSFYPFGVFASSTPQ